MGLLAGQRRRRLVHDLRSHMRLLLRKDPGRDQMVELARLFDPDARPGGAGRICVDAQRQLYLTRPSTIDPGTAAEAQAPPGLPVALLCADPGPFRADGHLRPAAGKAETARIRDLAAQWPGDPARRVRLAAAEGRQRSAAGHRVHTAAGHRGRRPRRDRAVHLRVHPPRGCLDGIDGGRELADTGRAAPGRAVARARHPRHDGPPAALGDVRFRSGQLYTTVLRLADPATRADPDAARAVGRAALAVAAATGGTCVDLLGFRVLQPDDLVMR